MSDGCNVGASDGVNEGCSDGASDGINDGCSVGASDGASDGCSVGESDGTGEGCSVGTSVGSRLGATAQLVMQSAAEPQVVPENMSVVVVTLVSMSQQRSWSKSEANKNINAMLSTRLTSHDETSLLKSEAR